MKQDETLDNLLSALEPVSVLEEKDFEILKSEIYKLRHYRDTSLGLYCIDRNPTEVDKEWIERNSFKLKF